MRKKLLKALLALCMALMLLPGPVRAAEVASGSCGDSITWTLDDAGTLTISGTGTMYDYFNNFRAPDPPWFDYCTDIQKVVIDDGVTSIGNYAFLRCENLSSIDIPESVTSIGIDAFVSCTSLSSIDIPESVASIGPGAFTNCKRLNSVTVPTGITEIRESMFVGCESLNSITLPESITEINSSTFAGCVSLSSITIPESVTRICQSAFSGCENLNNIIIPNSVTIIERSAFSGCTSLSNITLPDHVISFGSEMFSGCTNLSSITLPEGVTDLGGTFYGCTSLTQITLPAGVASIGLGTFNDCTKLSDVYYSGTRAQWDDIPLVEKNYDDAILLSAIIHCSDGDIVPEGAEKRYNIVPSISEDTAAQSDKSTEDDGKLTDGVNSSKSDDRSADNSNNTFPLIGKAVIAAVAAAIAVISVVAFLVKKSRKQPIDTASIPGSMPLGQSQESKFCPWCGASAPMSYHFCSKCGRKLDSREK